MKKHVEADTVEIEKKIGRAIQKLIIFELYIFMVIEFIVKISFLSA